MAQDFQNFVRERMRTLLKDAGYTDEALGDALGLDRSQAGRLIKDETVGITLDRVQKIAELLFMRPAELMADAGDEVQALTPLELGIVNRFRQMTSEVRFAWMLVLDWQHQKPLTRGKRRVRFAELGASAVEVAHRFQSASGDAQRLVLSALTLDASGKTRAPDGRTDDRPDQPATGNPVPAQKSRTR